jgi:hypothetical protein
LESTRRLSFTSLEYGFASIAKSITFSPGADLGPQLALRSGVIGTVQQRQQTGFPTEEEVMKRANREWLAVSALIVIAVALVTASCAAKHKTPVNGPVNDPGYGAVNGPGYGSAYGPVSTSAPADQDRFSYHSASSSISSPAGFKGYGPVKVVPPKRYGYIDPMTCPLNQLPKPTTPRK